MKYCTSLHFKTHSLLSKKKSLRGNNCSKYWAEEETGAKITRKMQMNKTGVNGADPAENQTPSYSAEVELEGNEVNPWPYSCSIMQC